MIDAAAYATNFVNADRAGLDQQFLTQKTLAENKIRALTSLDTKVSAFDSILAELSKKSSLSATNTILSQSGIISATSSEGATPASYSVEVSQLAKADSFAMTFTDESWVAPTTGNLTID